MCIDTHTLCILLLMHIIVQISKGVLLGLQTQSRLKNASRSKLELLLFLCCFPPDPVCIAGH